MSQAQQAVSVQKKRTIKQVVTDNWDKAGVAVGMTMLTSPVFAAAGTVDVSSVVSEISGAKTPIASVAGASLGAYVAIRVWKLVRRAI